jgi:hypothetical protein
LPKFWDLSRERAKYGGRSDNQFFPHSRQTISSSRQYTFIQKVGAVCILRCDLKTKRPDSSKIETAIESIRFLLLENPTPSGRGNDALTDSGERLFGYNQEVLSLLARTPHSESPTDCSASSEMPFTTQVSHGLEKTLANLPLPIDLTSFPISGTWVVVRTRQRDAIMVRRRAAADISNEVAVHDNGV